MFGIGMPELIIILVIIGIPVSIIVLVRALRKGKPLTDISDSKVQSIIDDSKLSNKKRLDVVTELYMKEGFIVNLRTDNQLQLIRKKQFSFLWALFWFLIFGIGILIYIFYFISKKDEQINITLPDDSSSQEKVVRSNADEISKLSDLLKKGILTKEEFELQKQKILAS